jgi:hypothetical protein
MSEYPYYEFQALEATTARYTLRGSRSAIQNAQTRW